MRTLIRVFATTCALLSSCLGAKSQTADVTTASGLLRGQVAERVETFKGVPFAAPPIGDLRWRAPQPPKPWTGVREANAYAADCMQLPFPSDAAPLGTTPAEDCLYLNVWRPKGTKSTDKLPVMVWIYGGGFVNGGSSPSVYDGSKFAERGIVFVSFNYRLGRFGFFGFPELTLRDPDGMLGNYGFMDQISALRWVQQNIATFGGDSGQVTVFGESAGGFSVNMLLTSPLGTGLFSKAIIESGGGRTNLNGQRYLSTSVSGGPVSAEEVGVRFAEAQGIRGRDAKALAALKALPASQIRGDLNMATSRTSAFSGPMVDGRIVVADPQAVLLSGSGIRVPIMIGANSQDIGRVTGDTKSALFDPFGVDHDRAVSAYDPDGIKTVAQVRTDMSMDRFMVEPARFIASVFASRHLPSFEYRFSYVAESLRKEWTGAPHATEIPYVFDTVASRYGAQLTPADEKIAQQTLNYWVAFAKTGDPSTGNSPAWPRYTPATDMLMNFTLAGPRTEKDQWRPRLDVTAAYITGSAP